MSLRLLLLLSPAAMAGMLTMGTGMPVAAVRQARARPQARLPNQQSTPAPSNGSGGPDMLLAQLRQENLELRARLADVEGVSTAASLLEVGFIFSCGLRTGLPPDDQMQ